MNKLIQIAALLWLVSTAGAQQTLVMYDWHDLKQNHQLRGGEVVNGESDLKIENTNDTPLQLHLFEIVGPPVSNTIYALTGQVKYDNVHGTGYLEMWNFFPPSSPGLPEGQYFSRTLGDAGNMEKITGTCHWRNFSLPFDRTGASGAPTRLEINIFLPGKGTVYLSPVKLVQYPKGFSCAGPIAPAGWWSANIAPWVGGIGGPAIGFFGGLLGWMSQKGKARKFVLPAWTCCIAFGIGCLIATLIALIVRHPWFVAMPLFIFGFVSTLIFSVTWSAARNRYDELEIRRMASMDATGR